MADSVASEGDEKKVKILLKRTFPFDGHTDISDTIDNMELSSEAARKMGFDDVMSDRTFL